MSKMFIKVVFFFLVFQSAVFSQSIETDRPDQTETPAIVPKNKFQFENGFVFEQNKSGSKSFLLPTVLSKYGVSENLELRLITEFIYDKTDDIRLSGISPVKIGFKVKLSDEKGIIPKTSFIGHLSIPRIASKELKSIYYAPTFRFTMQHTLTDKITLAYNLGSEWDGETPEPTFIYTLTTGFSLSEKMGSYIELYGFAPQNQHADHRFDGGFTYLLSNNAMIDMSAGFGITENAPDYFLGLGFSFRI